MISLVVPDRRRPFFKPPPRDPYPLPLRPGPGREPGSSFDFVGTAHFTATSIYDAIRAASSGLHSGVAIQLDRARFDGYGLNYSSPIRIRRARVN